MENKDFNNALKNLPLETQEAYKKTRDEIKVLGTKQNNLDTFCEELIQIIKKNLNFYSVNLYLIEKSKKYIVLKAGTEKISQPAIKADHKFEIAPNSFLGTIAFNRKSNFVVIDKQPDSSVWYSSVDLPPIQSELGIPIVFGSFLIGVIDICSDQYNAFQIEDCIVLEEILSETEIFFKKFQL